MKQRHEVVAVLDRSGSMSGQVDDVIGGFNTYITNIAKDSAAEGVDTNVTLVLFDDVIEVVYTSRPVQNLEPLTKNVYFTRGSTALLDAVGKAIEECKTAVNRPPNLIDDTLSGTVGEPEEVTVTFAIFTDGEENASQKHSAEQIADAIKELTDSGWTFLYLGADQDKWKAEHVSRTLNIAAGNTRAYAKSADNFNETFVMMSAGTSKRMRDAKAGITGTAKFFQEAEDELAKESGDNN